MLDKVYTPDYVVDHMITLMIRGRMRDACCNTATHGKEALTLLTEGGITTSWVHR